MNPPNSPEAGKRVARHPYQKSEKREKMILDAARSVFLEKGWDGFNVENIAEFMESSRTLVYAHFSCKEEVLFALAIQSKQKRLRLSEMTRGFVGRAREKMIAIDLMEGFLVERDLPVELLVTSTRLREKTSGERLRQLQALELESQKVGADIVREAVEAGDLVLPKNYTADELYFTLWSSIWGATLIQRSDFPYVEAGIPKPTVASRRGLLVMMDGFGWKPLSHEIDYRMICRTLEEQVFETEEFKRRLAY